MAKYGLYKAHNLSILSPHFGEPYNELDYLWRVSGYDSLYIAPYKILSRTKTGVWIKVGEYENKSGKKFVRNDAHKHWASKTQKLAMLDFVARKRKQCSILKSQSLAAEDAINLAQHMLEHDERLKGPNK